MSNSSLWALAIFAGLWSFSRANSCLRDRIPESQRHYLFENSSLKGESTPTPIRLVVYDWASADVASTLVEILIGEVLGYHVVQDATKTVSIFDGILKLAGCTSADCSQSQVNSHVAVETWLAEAITLFQNFQESNAAKAPEDLGSMGYNGDHNLFVKGSIRDIAYQDSGLALDFYKSFNTTFHKPQKYFGHLEDLDPEDFFLCDADGLEFSNALRMSDYICWTGDLGGVTQLPGGTYMARCPNGRFWLAPSCRHNSSECIPLLAAGNGWIVDAMMQWSTVYGFPVAIGIAASWDIFVSNVMNTRSLFYWWMPDATFLQLDPSYIVLPPHSPIEWSQGNLRTAGSQNYITKLVSPEVRASAPSVRLFLQNMKLELGEIKQLLLEVANGRSTFDTVCNWVIANTGRWRQWIPVETNCEPGFGLQAADGSPASARDGATGCLLCPAGSFSERLVDDFGETYRCVPCPAGSHQNILGKSDCLLCNPGYIAPEPGLELCTACEFGTYATSTGMMMCETCSNGTMWTTSRVVDRGLEVETWIEIEGAYSPSFCHCMKGYHLHRGECELCIEGSKCPGSSEMELLPGFFSFAEEPGEIFECFGSKERCPGGMPGTCASGRDPESVACGACLGGMRPDGGTCVACSSTDYVLLVVLCTLIVVCTGGVHIFLVVTDQASANQRSSLFTAALSLGHLITCAQLFSIMQQLQINWADPFQVLLDIFSFISLDAILSSVDAINCVARVTPEVEYLIGSLIVPLFFTIGPILAHFNVVYMMRRAGKAKSFGLHLLWKTLGLFSLIFFISLCSSFLEPFRCNRHPSGLRTLQSSHAVLCGFTGTHFTLCLIGGLVCLLPITYLALSCWIILVELPKRVRVADIAFIRACSFLVMRFHPGKEVFTVLFLIRNVLIVLAPLIPSSSASLFLMAMLLATSFGLIAYYKPWRSLLSTQVDMLTHLALLLILQMGALAVVDVQEHVTMIVCTACASFMIIAIVSAAAQSAARHILSKLHKQFHFFLCHHKASTACWARLLKMELRSRGSSFTAFLDSGNLTDLTQLFSYVSHDVKTFVVLGSSQILTRKWCLGEMVIARLEKVDTVLLTFPGFELPDEQFMKLYHKLVPDIGDFASYGFGIAEVRETLHWLSSVKQIPVNSDFTEGSLTYIINQLTNTFVSLPATTCRTDMNILADPENMEAISTAHVLAKLMAPLMMGSHISLPTVIANPKQKLVAGLADTQSSPHLIVLCTDQCLVSYYYASWLLQARHLRSCFAVPVVADDIFEIPSPVKIGKLVQSSRLQGLETIDTQAYAHVLKSIFLEIALPFLPAQSSEEDLMVKANQLALRLRSGTVTTLNNRLVMVDQQQYLSESPGNSPGKLHHGLEPENDEFELGDNESYTALGGVSSVALTPGRQSRPESEAMSEWKTPVTPDTKEAEFQMYAKMYFSPTVTAKF